MAYIFPVSRKFVAQPAQNGNIAVIGNAADGRVGTWMVQFVPSEDFVGSFGIVGRAYGKVAGDDEVPYQSVPYRRVSLNGVASDYAIATAAVGGTADIIQIPSNGLNIGLLIAASAGECAVYSWDLNGPSAI